MSAGAVKGPRAGSRQYSWLKRLYELGGQATSWDWQVKTGHAEAARFLNDIDGLVGQGMVYQRGDLFLIADAGMIHIGEEPHAPPADPAPPAAPRLAPVLRSLSASKRPRPQSIRAGAFDYIDIPSRYGATQVAFRSAVTLGGDKQG